MDWIPGELVVLFDIPNAQSTRNSIFGDMAVIYIVHMLDNPELYEIDRRPNAGVGPAVGFVWVVVVPLDPPERLSSFYPPLTPWIRLWIRK